MAVTAITFTLTDKSGIRYLELLDELIMKSIKEGEVPNRSEYVRKLIVREAKKAGLL